MTELTQQPWLTTTVWGETIHVSDALPVLPSFGEQIRRLCGPGYRIGDDGCRHTAGGAS